MSGTRLVEVRANVLKHNDVLARSLRERFHRSSVYVVSLVSSPGAGKTAFAMQAVTDALRLTPTLRVLVANVEMPPAVLLDLARKGVSREQAYQWVQRNAMRSFQDGRDFKGLLLEDPDVVVVLAPAEIEEAFNLDQQLRHVDEVFRRVFQEVSV